MSFQGGPNPQAVSQPPANTSQGQISPYLVSGPTSNQRIASSIQPVSYGNYVPTQMDPQNGNQMIYPSLAHQQIGQGQVLHWTQVPVPPTYQGPIQYWSPASVPFWGQEPVPVMSLVPVPNLNSGGLASYPQMYYHYYGPNQIAAFFGPQQVQLTTVQHQAHLGMGQIVAQPMIPQQNPIFNCSVNCNHPPGGDNNTQNSSSTSYQNWISQPPEYISFPNQLIPQRDNNARVRERERDQIQIQTSGMGAIDMKSQQQVADKSNQNINVKDAQEKNADEISPSSVQVIPCYINDKVANSDIQTSPEPVSSDNLEPGMKESELLDSIFETQEYETSKTVKGGNALELSQRRQVIMPALRDLLEDEKLAPQVDSAQDISPKNAHALFDAINIVNEDDVLGETMSDMEISKTNMMEADNSREMSYSQSRGPTVIFQRLTPTDIPLVRTQTSLVNNVSNTSQSTSKNAKLFVCSRCGFQMGSSTHLKYHMNAHEAETPYRCDKCLFISVYKHSLVAHAKTHDDKLKSKSKAKPFTCPSCGYQMPTKTVYDAHINAHEDDEKYSCDRCLYITENRESLRSHMKTHDGVKKYSCHLCAYASAWKKQLNRHLIAHLGEKEFSCKLCKYKCRKKSGMIKHILKHDSVTTDKVESLYTRLAPLKNYVF